MDVVRERVVQRIVTVVLVQVELVRLVHIMPMRPGTLLLFKRLIQKLLEGHLLSHLLLLLVVFDSRGTAPSLCLLQLLELLDTSRMSLLLYLPLQGFFVRLLHLLLLESDFHFYVHGPALFERLLDESALQLLPLLVAGNRLLAVLVLTLQQHLIVLTRSKCTFL